MAQAAIESEFPPEDEPKVGAEPTVDGPEPVPPASVSEPTPEPAPPVSEPTPAPVDAFVMSAGDEEPPVEAPKPERPAGDWRRAPGGEPSPVPPPEAAFGAYGSRRPSPSPVAAGDKTMPALVYVLFLAGFLTAGLTSLVGAVLAHMNRDEAPEWVRSHYVFQIRTFWIGLAATVLGALTFFFAIGPFIWMAAGLWTAIRCAMGLNQLLKDRPYPNPQTWTV